MSSGRTSWGRIGPQEGRRRAFTLVELLVVIAILALLMAILLPVIHRVRKHAAAVTCQSNLRQWGILLDTYTTANDGKFFSQWTHVDNQPGVTVWVQSWWYIFLTDFRDYRDIWLCPMAMTPSATGAIGATFRAWRTERGAAPLPAGGWAEVARELRGSYGVNGWVGPCQRPGPDPDPDRPNASCWSTPYVKGAANVPLVFDCRCSSYYGTLDDPPPCEDADPSSSYSGMVCIDRHAGGINSVFMDWSVRKVGLKQLWGLKWNTTYNTAGPWTPAGRVQPQNWPEWLRRFKDN
jgi:prepilin-type N-terminal cleavage/methylation domain-containing protein